MNETQMNGTHVEETPDDGMPTDGGAGDGWDVEKARRARLRGFLQDLIRQEGKMEAAELLGVNHKTLTRAEESGEITGRMADALELLLRRADDAEVVRLREAVGALERRVEELEGDVETPDAEEAEGGGEGDGTEAQAQKKQEDDTESRAKDGKDGEGAGRSESRAAPKVVRLRPVNPDTLRPFDPEIVTVQPADDDVEIYGAAWPWSRSGGSYGPVIPITGGSPRMSGSSFWNCRCWKSTG